MKTFGITGATGYIGGFLFEELLKQGNKIKVYSSGSTSKLDQKTGLARPAVSFLEDKYRDNDHVSFYSGYAEDQLTGFVDGVDAIFHLGALYDTKRDYKTVTSLVEGNILLSSQLLSLLEEYSPNASFLSASTFSCFDSFGGYNPRTIYSATKQAVEDMAESFKVKTAFLRLSDTYGPYDMRPKIQNLIRNKLLLNEDFKMNSPYSQKICLTHVTDVTRAFVRAYEEISNSKSLHEKYDIYYPQNIITLDEVAEKFNNSSLSKGIVSCGDDYSNLTLLPPQKRILNNFSLKYNPHEDLVEETFKITEEQKVRILSK